MSLSRRHFLHFAGSTLTALGLNQWDVQQQAVRYAQVMAQGTPRKLALLVGINAYPESSQFATLQGCLTDVELQRQLLIHRFGFQPQDILTVTDGKATRQGILTAFEEHLIKQAKPGDVVVFHYSGHGSQVSDPDRDTPDGLNSTFVPVDSVLPSEFPEKGGVVKDVMGHTLFLLTQALQTENVTIVLDSCHSGGGLRGERGDKRGNLQLRSHRYAKELTTTLQASPAEFEYQKQWLSRLKLTPAEFIRLRRAGIAKGVAIAATKRDQLAADAPFSDFYAGAFTYLMTQYLWQATGTATVSSAIPSIARSTTSASSSSQEPQYEVKPGSGNEQLLYFTPLQTAPAEAVITKVEGDRAELWLGGLNPQSLAAFGRDAVLGAVDREGRSLGQVKLESRQGLVGRGKLLNAAQPGALLQEQVRGIPTGLTLKLGLDRSLEPDLTQAKQALQAIKRIDAMPLYQGDVQYILGRMTAANRALRQSQGTENAVPPVGSIGLFYPGSDWVPGSFGAVGEAVTDAVQRLQPKLKALLAARLVKLTLNPTASRLHVSVAMNLDGTNRLLASTFTVRGAGKTASGAVPAIAHTNDLPLGTSLQFQIVNQEARDLYINVLVIDSTGEMTVIFPNQWSTTADAMKVAAGKTLRIPEPGSDRFNLVTQEPKGITEVLAIASTVPLGGALKALQTIASRGGQSRGPIALTDPTEAIGQLLDDLDSSTRGRSGRTASASAIRRIDTSQLAALSITFNVI